MNSLTFYDVSTVSTPTTLTLDDAAPGSSDDTMLRVLNTSDLYQAEDVTVSLTGPDAIQLWLSTDGDTFTASIEVGDIAPGGTSATFWLRRVTPTTHSPGTCTAQLTATPTAWTSPVDTSGSTNIPLDTEG